jgi:hypothetical protein
MDSPESVELSQLRAENAQLRAAMQAQSGAAVSPARPWWKSSATITTLTAIVAAVVPLTTAVRGWVQKNRELALESQKQANAIAMQRERQVEDIRTSYLDRLKTPGEHLRTLRFVIATTNDTRLRDWAVNEKKETEDELRKLDQEIRQAEEAAEKARTTGAKDAARLKEIEARTREIAEKRRRESETWFNH